MTAQKYTLTLTKEEKNALLQIIDVAVRSQGISAAEVCLILTKKITEAVESI